MRALKVNYGKRNETKQNKTKRNATQQNEANQRETTSAREMKRKKTKRSKKMNPMAAVVPKEDFDYFDSLLELRRQEVERQKTRSYADYMPPDYNDFKVWKGVEKINNVMKKLHPAYEVFMEWREGEMIKENIEAERRWALLEGLHHKRECFWDRIQRLKGSTLRRHYANYTHYSDPRITASESYYDKYAGFLYGENYEYYFDKFGKKQDRDPYLLMCWETRIPQTKYYQRRCKKKIKKYKKRAHAIRLLQKKDEIRKDAKTVFGSCGDAEDAIANHLDSLYHSIHHCPVNYGRIHYDAFCGYWDNWSDYFPPSEPPLLYSDLIRHNRQYFPTLTEVELREARQYEDIPVSIEFSSKLLLTHRNLPIP